jgi:hypothetical protein
LSKTQADHLSEDQVKSVISRAIELDARGLTTAEELRAIASEIGISAEAVETALREHARALEPQAPRTSGRAASVVVAGGVPLGIVAGTVLSTGGPLAVLSALGVLVIALGVSGALVVLQGKDATVRSFQLRNLLLWTGVTAGGYFAASLFVGFPGIILGWGLRGWVASSILGSAAVIAVRRATGPGQDSPPPTSDRARSSRARLLHALKRTVDWVSRILRREADRILSNRGHLDAFSPSPRRARNVSA